MRRSVKCYFSYYLKLNSRVLTLKLDIEHNEALLPYCEQYSHALRIIYNDSGRSHRNDLKVRVLKQNPLLDVFMFECVENQVKRIKEIYKFNIKEKNEVILEYSDKIKKEKNPKNIFKYDKARNKLIGGLDNEIVFGGRYYLKLYTANLNKYNKTGEKEYLEIANRSIKTYRENRIIPYHSIGAVNYGGNRKFIVEKLLENILIFRPRKGVDIELKIINLTRKKRHDLAKIQQAVMAGVIPITVEFTVDSVCISYDNERLAGFAFDAVEYQRAKKALKEKTNYKNLSKEQQELITPELKALKYSYYQEQEQRQLAGKIKDRVAAIDMNPEYIGLTIRNKKEILFTRCFDLSQLLKKTKGNNTKEIQANLGAVYREIFKELKHYNVAYFITEELDFNKTSKASKKANRENNRLWCREFQADLIKKHCQNLGIIHNEIFPEYSSYVGNMTYDFFDPVAAAAELARRGLVLLKKIDEKWYPEQSTFRLDNLIELNCSVGTKKPTYVPVVSSWDEAQLKEFRSLTVQSGLSLIKSRNMRYRRTTKHGHISKLVKCEVFSGKPEDTKRFDILGSSHHGSRVGILYKY